MTEAFICDYVRTPIGRYAGALKEVEAESLAATVIKAVIERSGRTFRRLANTYSALFIVNDDPYLAMELGADGVHVGQDDIDPPARRLGLSSMTPFVIHLPFA